MNKDKIKALAERIVEQPEQFDMSWWFHGGKSWSEPVSKCETAACYAGHVCLMDGLVAKDDYCAMDASGRDHGAMTYAIKALDITPAEASRLFNTIGWPEAFLAAYQKAVDAKDWPKAACVAAERLHHFVLTEGRE